MDNHVATSSQVQHISIDAAHAGQRLDNFLLGQLKNVPRSHIYRLLRTGQVRVNSGRAKPLYRLKFGDSVRLPPVHRDVQESPLPAKALLRGIQGTILWEDDEYLVMNKPAGMAVHGGSGLQGGVIEALRCEREGFLELGHRLDRETSGCLVLAKQRESLLWFQQQLQANAVQKQYQALVLGVWQAGDLRVEQPLSRAAGDGLRQVTADEDGKYALSYFSLAQPFREFSLLNVSLATGRTHQIRVHAAELGHPLAGDSRYGDHEINRQLRRQGLKRQFLHAGGLSFMTSDGECLSFEAPLPEDLQVFLDQLP